MNPFFMMNILSQVRQIKQNPNQLSQLLKQRGIINDQQVQDIQNMGSNYEQIGQYLMNSGKMPTNIQPYQEQVNQVQNMMQNTQN